MKSGSITLKLLVLFIGAFLLSSALVLMVADDQLRQIIDRSQNAVYEEKIEAVWKALEHVDNRLQKTGLVEAYAEDFKNSILTELRGIYYTQDKLEIYPFIVNATGHVMMHPTLPTGAPLEPELPELGQEDEGYFTHAAATSRWYHYKKFGPWDWIIAYTVPLEIKYQDAHIFINTLIRIMASVAILILAIFSFVLTRFTKPIVRLTHAASHIADGNLDQEIIEAGKDEVGTLARSFKNMRDAIRHQITNLNREIEERKEAEQKLQRNEENLRTTLDSIGDAVIATDTQGIVVRMNPVAETLVGWTFAEAKGRPLKEIFHIINGQTREEVTSPVDRVLATGMIVELANHTVLISRDGTEYQIADSGAPIRSDMGESIGVVLVFRDVTQEHALQEQLQQSQKMDAIGQLAGGIAHDFNNMLGGIMGATELLQQYLVDSPQASKLHDLILSAADRAAGLTQKLLAFSRKEPAGSGLIDVHKTIQDTVALLKSTVDRRIQLDIHLNAECDQVVGDASQIQNAILNLGINASHAMPEGGTIFIGTRRLELDPVYCKASSFDLDPGAYIEIELRDTGCGIPSSVLPRIFEPFYTTKETGKGTGLGLSVAFGTVQQHRGSISVYSEEGVGTSFHILLPLMKNVAGLHEAEVKEQAICGVGSILVVDDETVMRLTAQAILEELGYHISLAENGQKALVLYQAHPQAFDLVLLDMIMPEMNGRDCFNAMRKINPNQRIVLSSGFSREDDIKQMQEDGLNGYIRKPYRSISLSQIVAKALRD